MINYSIMKIPYKEKKDPKSRKKSTLEKLSRKLYQKSQKDSRFAYCCPNLKIFPKFYQRKFVNWNLSNKRAREYYHAMIALTSDIRYQISRLINSRRERQKINNLFKELEQKEPEIYIDTKNIIRKKKCEQLGVEYREKIVEKPEKFELKYPFLCSVEDSQFSLYKM